MRNRKYRQERTLIDMTSFMDIIFILLIFVMLSVSFGKKFKQIQVDLPKDQGAGTTVEKSLILELSIDGTILTEGKKISGLEFSRLSRQELYSGKDILLLADKNIKYNELLVVIQELKKGKAKSLNLGVQTDRKTP